ncbi:unnamed protein product, partial [Sphacelaria rigidula]
YSPDASLHKETHAPMVASNQQHAQELKLGHGLQSLQSLQRLPPSFSCFDATGAVAARPQAVGNDGDAVGPVDGWQGFSNDSAEKPDCRAAAATGRDGSRSHHRYRTNGDRG